MYGTVITERDVKESVSSSFTYNSMHLKGEDDIIASHDINKTVCMTSSSWYEILM